MVGKPTEQRIGIREVAQAAGVAPSTVSLVLNGQGRVAARTRDAVRRAARELKYVPSGRGRPRSRPRRSSGLEQVALLAAPKPSMLQSPVYHTVLQGVESALAVRGKALVLRHLPHGQPFLPDFLHGPIGGVIVFGRSELFRSETIQRELLRRPCVRVMGFPETSAHWDHVSYDDAAIGRTAAAHLLARGHRHCFYLGPLAPKAAPTRGAAFSAAIAAAGGTVFAPGDVGLIVSTEQTHEISHPALMRSVERFLSVRPRPTAAFVAGDMLLPPLYMALLEKGLRPGRDLEIVGCNCELPFLAGLHPRPVSVDIHAKLIGERAVEQLLWRIDHPRAPQVVQLLTPTIKE